MRHRFDPYSGNCDYCGGNYEDPATPYHCPEPIRTDLRGVIVGLAITLPFLLIGVILLLKYF